MRKFINKKTVGGTLVVLLALLMLASKTIYSYNLPEVTATKPQNGNLNNRETTSGVCEWDLVEAIYAQVSGTVGEVLVSEGETVSAGQPMWHMEYDRDEIERALKELEADRERLRLEIQTLQLSIEKQERAANTAANEVNDMSNYEHALAEAQTVLDEAQTGYEDGQLLYELGEISLRELEQLETAVLDAQRNYDNTLNQQEKLGNETKSTLADGKSDLAALRLDVQAKNLELQNLELKEEPYRKILADYDTYAVITAPVDGQILELQLERGAYVEKDTKLASMGTGNQFRLTCTVPLENNFIVPGDSCKLSNSMHNLDGQVVRIVPTTQGKTVEVSFSSDEVTSGETFEAVFEKKSEISYILVPNGALFRDNDGYYVNQIKQRDGIMGSEYYLERLNVYIGTSDDNNTAIIRGITFFEPLMLLSDKPVDSGEVIRLKNESDFFAD